jgi:hypothetical protein
MTETTEYAILLPGDESRWERATEAERAAMYARHEEFMRLLHERGHRITGGAELTHSRTARVVRGTLDDVSVTEGPFAETVEQLSGFYLVATDDLDDLLRVCGLLAGPDGLEVRALVPAAAQAATSEPVESVTA